MISFNKTETQELLCLCIRHCDFLEKDRIRELYQRNDPSDIFDEAKLNGVASIVAHALVETLGHKDVPQQWHDEYSAIESKLTAYMSELDKVATLLAKNDIELLALKNSGITKGMYPHWGACPMGDIDVLVDRAKFRKAHSILVDAGYTLKFRSPFEEENIDAAEEGGGAEYSVTMDNGEHLWFELQWRPVAGRWIQPKQEPDASELIARSVAIPGSDVRLLSPEDNLLQVALHTAKHTFVRAPGFRLHTDVDRIVSTQTIDWQLFLSRVSELRTKTAVFLSLAMAQSLLHTEIPDFVLDSLRPASWKVELMTGWIEKVGVFEPDQKKWGKLGYMVFVSLLYDQPADFARGVLPDSDDMKDQYQFSSSWKLPYYHSKRLANLVLRRINT